MILDVTKDVRGVPCRSGTMTCNSARRCFPVDMFLLLVDAEARQGVWLVVCKMFEVFADGRSTDRTLAGEVEQNEVSRNKRCVQVRHVMAFHGWRALHGTKCARQATERSTKR